MACPVHLPLAVEDFKGRMSKTDMLCRWQLVIGEYLSSFTVDELHVHWMPLLLLRFLQPGVCRNTGLIKQHQG
jgi:hypothetical protein